MNYLNYFEAIFLTLRFFLFHHSRDYLLLINISNNTLLAQFFLQSMSKIHLFSQTQNIDKKKTNTIIIFVTRIRTRDFTKIFFLITHLTFVK